MTKRILEHRLYQKERELRTVTEISRILGQTLPLRVMLDHIAAEVANLLGCPYGAILLSHPEDHCLTIEGAYGLDPHYIELVNTQSNLRMDDIMGLPSGEAYRSGKPIVWEDVRVSPTFTSIQEAVRFQGYIAMVAVPLNGPNGPLGTLTCYQTTTYQFSEDELSLLTTIANHAAMAIHNKYLLDQLNDNVTRLTELNQILEQQHETLAQSEAIHRRFTRLVLEERGLPYIVETLASLLNRGVCLYNQHLIKITQAAAPSADEPEPAKLTPSLLAKTWQEYVINKPASLIHLPAGPYLAAPTLLAPLSARGQVLGYLVIPDTPKLTGELEQRAIEHAVTVCSLELVKQRISLEVERRMRGNFIDDLLTGRFTGDREIRRRAAHFGYDLQGPYRILSVDVDLFRRHVEQHHLSETQVEDLKQQLTDLVEQTTHQTDTRAIVATFGDRAVILWPCASKESLDYVTDFASRLMATVRHTLINLTISVGISTVVNKPAEFSRGHQEALEALATARNFGQQEALIVFDELGVYSLLLRNTNPKDLLRFAHRLLDPLIAREQQRPADLIKTLEIALKYGLSPRQTAKKLFVHVNTVKYRLKQVRELTGVDFSDTKQVLELQLALLIRRLAGATFDALE